MSALVIHGADQLAVTLAPAAVEQRDTTLALATTITEVADPAGLQIAVHAIKELRQIQKAAEDARTEVKRPVLDLGKLIDAKAKEFAGPLDSEITRLHRLVQAYQAKVEAERREAERRRQEEIRKAQEAEAEARRKAEQERRAAEEEARRAEEAARAEADPFAEAEAQAAAQAAAVEAARKIEEARAAAEAATKAATVATAGAIAPTRPQGVAVRSEPDFEVLSIEVLAKARPDLCNIAPKRAEILSLLRRRGAFEGRQTFTDIPGIRAWWDGKVVVR